MIDIKVGEEKETISQNTKETNFNEIRYIQEYIKFYYEKTEKQLRINKTLLIIAIVTLVINLMPNIIKFIIFLLVMKTN